MWQIGKTYAFVPSGDATELHLKIVEEVPLEEGIAWYEKIYDRSFELDATRAFKTTVVMAGYDADRYHRKGSTYYVFDTDFGPSHSQPEGPQIVQRPPTLRERGFHEEHWGPGERIYPKA